MYVTLDVRPGHLKMANLLSERSSMLWSVVCGLTLFISLACADIPSFSPTEQEHRPQFHFLPESNWMNDPNAPFYDPVTGFYHLFYQYLTPRVWGHAISQNLADWSILPIALNYSDSLFTSMPNSTPGVYSGSALLMELDNGRVVPWLSVSVPTNDMQLLAYPKDLSDPHYVSWIYDEASPSIYSPAPSAANPPGRDPTEVWQCGLASENKYCLTYATQASEGCPCSGVSGSVVFSSVFNSTPGSTGAGSWGSWEREGYLLNDTVTDPSEAAIMWECTDLFPLVPEEDIWLFKYSIGSFNPIWGSPGLRDYYVTGEYRPLAAPEGEEENREVSTTKFTAAPEQWAAAMARGEEAALDTGAFYASKSFDVPGVGRLLFGWLPEERPVDSNGEPYGWAGVMSLPRLMLPYQARGDDSYSARTPPLESALAALHSQEQRYLALAVSSELALSDTKGVQLDISTTIGVRGMQDEDACGLRLLSSLLDDGTTPTGAEGEEYTEVFVQFHNCSTPPGSPASESSCGSVTLSVDTTHSTADPSIPVNRSMCSSGSLDVTSLLLEEGEGVQLQAVLDHSVLETFLGGGRRAVSRRVYPSAPQEAANVQLFSRCGPDSNINEGGCQCQFLSTSAWTMRSADSSTLDSSSSSGTTSVNWVYYSVSAVVTASLFVFFGYRYFFRGNDFTDSPLIDKEHGGPG